MKTQLRGLRDYQTTINKGVKEFLEGPERLGQVYSPTGSGKTLCFSHTIHDLPDIIKQTSGKRLNICIVHPRIALSQDQLSRFKEVFGKKYHYTSFHSGSHTKGDEEIAEFNTLDPETLKRTIENTDRTHITFSSYDSFGKIAHFEFDLLILDEAHNLVQNQYFDTLSRIAAKKALFYTATPIVSELIDFGDDEMRGMNNVELFGRVIASVEPKVLIERGYIVPPLLHFMTVETDKSSENADTLGIIVDAFNNQRAELAKYGMENIQMLVTSRGYTDHENIERQLPELWERIGKVPVYVIEAASVRKDGVQYLGNERVAVLTEIKALKGSCIVIHYDTISEGIDIDSLTGVCIMRNLSKYKLLQTIGRCGRPLVTDTVNGEVVDMKNRKKPFCIITLPVVDGVHIGNINSADIADAFGVGGYGELSTYLTNEDRKNLGLVDNAVIIDSDEMPLHLAPIVSTMLRRNVETLKKLGYTF